MLPKKLVIFCCSTWLFLGILSAEFKYQTFELGFNPEAKISIIKKMMSSEGTLVSIRPGTVFIRDEQRILKDIENLLKQPSLDRVQQIRIQLRRVTTGEIEKREHDIGFSTSKQPSSSRSFQFGLKLGQQRHNINQHQEQSIVTLSGRAAYLRLSTSKPKILQWRRRFLAIDMHHIEELEALRVLPIRSGKNIRLSIKSVYRVRDKAKWQSFDTGEIDTNVIVRPGQWLNIGGSQRSLDDRKRQLWGLSGGKKEGFEHLNFEVQATLE
jgi:hypothetical protein